MDNRRSEKISIKQKTNHMSKEKQIEMLNDLIDQLEVEMWQNIHADAPHQAHKVKGWADQLKEQAKVLQTDKVS